MSVDRISKDPKRCGVTPSPRHHRGQPRISAPKARRNLEAALERAERAGDRTRVDHIRRLMGAVR